MNSKAIINSEFVFHPQNAPFDSCHSSTIAETPAGLVCARFAGPYEGHPDVEIWLSRCVNKSWANSVNSRIGFAIRIHQNAFAMDSKKTNPSYD